MSYGIYFLALLSCVPTVISISSSESNAVIFIFTRLGTEERFMDNGYSIVILCNTSQIISHLFDRSLSFAIKAEPDSISTMDIDGVSYLVMCFYVFLLFSFCFCYVSSAYLLLVGLDFMHSDISISNTESPIRF